MLHLNNRNRAAQNTGDDFKKNVAFPEGNKLFAGDFVLIWMKQTLIWFNLQRDGTRNGLSNIKETFAESLQPQMPVLHQRMIYDVLSSLSSSYDGWAKCKEKVPDMSDPNQNVEATCDSKLKFTELKYSSKGCRKTSQRYHS